MSKKQKFTTKDVLAVARQSFNFEAITATALTRVRQAQMDRHDADIEIDPSTDTRREVV